MFWFFRLETSSVNPKGPSVNPNPIYVKWHPDYSLNQIRFTAEKEEKGIGLHTDIRPISSVLALKIVQSDSFNIADPKLKPGSKILIEYSPLVIPGKLRASMGLCCTQLVNGKKVVS
ncbi:hypothetical protein [Flagellimonas baculiformis]|uniref:hypothetical protein n=1 Tax=Flagellimonas baculiformis TaxID=3067310 RepID=UPI00296F32E7|nr:hypothetical protein [Muricauda sp. D6]